MKLLRRLDIRLLLSYVGVIAVTLAVMVGTLRVLAPSEFEAQVERIGQQYGFGRAVPPSTSDTTGSTPLPAGSQPGDTGSTEVGPTDTIPASDTAPNTVTTTTLQTTPGSGPGDGDGGPGDPGGNSGTGGSGSGGGGDGASPPPGNQKPPVHGANAVQAIPFELAQQGPGGPEGTETIVIDLETAFDEALTAGMWVALIASLIVATALAYATSRRILRPLRNVQAATRRLADGRYDERVPIPNEVELAELAADVNALGETLEKSEQQRSRLMSDLAHELRTPLTTIQGYMEGLIDGVFEPTPEVFGEVAEEATRLKRLTADLALLSRAEEGALILDLRTTDLGDIATRAAERLRPQFHDKEVELSIGPMPGLPIHGDEDRLAQVFTNIIGNALVHTPEGGRVWLTASDDETWSTVSVNDTGEGIPSDELEMIFERFHRVEGAGVVYAGSGIGLTISKTIVRSHNGDLAVESAGSGRGATFTIRVPRLAK